MSSLPEKSRKKYEAVFQAFMDWRSLKNDDSFSEELFLTYFEKLSETYSSPSLYAYYSMLRSTLKGNYDIDLGTYSRLRDFLKQKSEGYQSKKSKTFTTYEVNKFISEAPDKTYLATKVALIMGIMGACRANEMHAMTIEDFQDLGSAMLVTIRNRTKIGGRQFTITGHFYELCKKYVDLRPNNATSNSFFLNYQKGKCTVQNIGINKFGVMGRQIALFLKLPNPELYTGNSFRKSSKKVLLY